MTPASVSAVVICRAIYTEKHSELACESTFLKDPSFPHVAREEHQNSRRWSIENVHSIQLDPALVLRGRRPGVTPAADRQISFIKEDRE